MDKSKVGFGLGQLTNETPEWANWIFRGYFIISKAIIGYVAALAMVKELSISIVVVTVITLTVSLLLDPIMYGFSKLFGVIPEPVDTDKPFVASQQVDEKGNVNTIPPVVLPPQAGVPVQETADANILPPQISREDKMKQAAQETRNQQDI